CHLANVRRSPHIAKQKRNREINLKIFDGIDRHLATLNGIRGYANTASHPQKKPPGFPDGLDCKK
ncbi:MAG TPA: hypothetical protein VET25_05610, partial [Aestuariivirgaceae bacterium]|nr:hypothetical protein [Aestuariivirgaceae bacterium]